MIKEKDSLNNNNINSDARGRRPLAIAVFISVIIMLIASATGFYFYAYTAKNLESELNPVGQTEYSQYYALICDDSDFNSQIYEHAKARGDELGICVDMLSKRVNQDYTIEELFEIAMQSKVDGIIVEAAEGQKMKNLIDTACSKDIDVVTLLSDSPDSLRRSSIQVGAYNLGKKYGTQIISKKMNGDEKILVVNNSTNSESSQNLIYKGIQDFLSHSIVKDNKLQFESYLVDGSDTFVMEEMIRSIFIDEDLIPDIIICPDDQATEIVYQALVDYNRVGQVRLLGYHDSQTIISGIMQGVIEASIAVDVKEIGEYAVEALSEYKSTGFASGYYSVDSTLIDIENVSDYIRTDESISSKEQ